MKIIHVVIIASLVAGTGAGVIYKSHTQKTIKNMNCYIVLDARYESSIGEENINALINISFTDLKGNISTNATVSTAENIKFPISQRMTLTYSASKDNDYLLKIEDLMNKKVEDVIPKNMSSFMQSMIYTHFIKPEVLNFKITPETDGNYLISSNAIPFGYCNTIRNTP
ncbi:hypothetical protein C9426_04935 [Serratia sp. S1B]|nr:hypothetical protein C9426_04935 [Serratia sp. S1B]